MTEFASPVVLVVPGLFLFIAFSLAALLLLARRGVGPMRLASPRCSRCDHPVPAGLGPCPECGLPPGEASLLHGRRTPSVRWMATSLVMAIAIVAAGIGLGGLATRVVGLPWVTRPHRDLDLDTLTRSLAERSLDTNLGREFELRVGEGVPVAELAGALTAALSARGSPPPQVSESLLTAVSRLRTGGLADDEWNALLDALVAPPQVEVRFLHRSRDEIEIRIGAPFWALGHIITQTVTAVRCQGHPCRIRRVRSPHWMNERLVSVELPDAIASPEQGGTQELEMTVEVLQALFTGMNLPKVPPAGREPDTTAAEWLRRTTATVPFALLAPSVESTALFELVTEPDEAPWGPGLDTIHWLELRPLDERTLVVLDVRPDVEGLAAKGMCVSGQWFLSQDDRRIALGRVSIPAEPMPWSSRDHRSATLVEPAVDPHRSFTLIFKPDTSPRPQDLTRDRLWFGRLEIPVRPGALRRVDDAFGTRLIHASPSRR